MTTFKPALAMECSPHDDSKGNSARKGPGLPIFLEVFVGEGS
jgi:hypothetical protein